MNWPPLPSPLPQGQTESQSAYAARLLTWVIVTGVTATLTDAQLDLTEWAATRALTTRVLVGPPDARESTPASVYDTIEEIRRSVCRALHHRRAESVTATPTPQPQAVPPKDGGSLSRTIDAPIIRPPSYDRAIPDIAF